MLEANPHSSGSAAATLSAQWDYWEKQLRDAPVLMELPTDFPRPAVQTGRHARYEFQLGEDLHRRLKELSEAHGASVYLNLLTGFSVLLSRYSGETDICIASAAADSALTNMLVIRSNLSEHPSFIELLIQTRDLVNAASAHAGLPLEYLIEKLRPNRSQSHAALAQVCFFMQRGKQQVSLPQDTVNPNHPSEQFDLALTVNDNSVLAGTVDYNSDLFKAATIERMVGHLRNVLLAASANPAMSISKLPLLSAREYQQIVFEWNATSASYPNACVHELFQHQVAQTPNARAVVFDDQTLTYAELNARANQLAHYLTTQGVGPDVLVGVCVKRSLEMVVALLGILKAGGAYVPLDPAYPADRLAYMIEDAKPALLLTQESLVDYLQHDGVSTLCLDRDWPSLSKYPDIDLLANAAPHTLAYVIYTSGSTGKPKGVALAHEGLCNLCLAQAHAFEVDDTSQVLQFASISFDAAVSEVFVTLTQGACLHLMKQEALRSAYEITKVLEKSAITTVTLPPSLLAVLPPRPLPALKTLVLAGEAWSPELAKIWSPNRRLLNAYGPTEATVCATWFKVEAPLEHTVPIGRPLSNVNVYILDEHLAPTPVGVPGELYISGIGLARGYLGRPDLTAERFVFNPFDAQAGTRMYRTGDKARYLEDGNIEFLGRIDHQVKLRGYRIELGEIETTLMAHESVTDAAVMVREDHPGEKRLVAYVVGETTLNAQLLKNHLKSTLPDFMLPQNFVFLEAMPMSPNGKLDRKALPVPGFNRPGSNKTDLQHNLAVLKNGTQETQQLG